MTLFRTSHLKIYGHNILIEKTLVCLTITSTFLIGMFLNAKYYLLSFFPKYVQLKTLRRILLSNQDIEFGVKHQFNNSKDYLSYASNVKINTYEYFRNYILESIETSVNKLFNLPVDGYITTSGTTGKPKYLLQNQAIYKKERFYATIIALFYILIRDISCFFRKITVIVSMDNVGENLKDLKKSCAYEASTSSIMFRSVLAVPFAVFHIKEYDARYYYINLFLILHSSRLIITPNPNTIQKLASIKNDFQKQLLKELNSGQLENYFNIEEKLFTAIKNEFVAIQNYYATLHGATKYKANDLYRNIKAIMCWNGGNCKFFLPQVMELFTSPIQFYELGYQASDAQVVYHLGGKGKQITILDQVFLEFIPANDDYRKEVTTLLLHELEIGKRYNLIITNTYGLYRYNIEDIVEVYGKCNNTPLYKFVQKSKGFSNITGEKLSEDQVLTCLKKLDTDRRFNFFICLPNLTKIRYDFFIDIKAHASDRSDDCLANEIDDSLKLLNIEYESKRDSHRLNPPKVHRLEPNAYEKYKVTLLESGMKEAQFKVMVLHPNETHRPIIERLVVV